MTVINPDQSTELLSTKKDVLRCDLLQWLNQSLDVSHFKDYCPNGLQVEGKERIAKIVTGVTASAAFLEAAIAAQADAVLVHHGWFWRNEDPCVIKNKKQRLALCLNNDLNLIAYHLPLDAHVRWGNNVQLGQRLGIDINFDEEANPRTYGSGHLVMMGEYKQPKTLNELSAHVAQVLGQKPLVIGNEHKVVTRIAWCTGAAQSYFQEAIDAGADVFITGEYSESTYHLACESGVAFIGAGHHATERFGVQALGQAISEQFGVECQFIDIPNPI